MRLYALCIPTLAASILLAAVALLAKPTPLVASCGEPPGACSTSAQQCGCPDQMTNPQTGQCCWLQSYSCIEGGGECERSCTYACNPE